MAHTPQSNIEEDEDIRDITYNLPSLQFESALTDDEKELLFVRIRSHVITVSACAHATYFTSVMSEAKQIAYQLRQPVKKSQSKLLQEMSKKNPLLIGIIGCGRMGSHIANCLLTYGEVNPTELKISTRRPETLLDLQTKGVLCIHNNKQVASSVHLLFICVLPSQVGVVADDVKNHIPKKCVLYSLVSATTVPRLQKLFHHDNVIKPEFEWDIISRQKPWDNTLDVATVFKKPEILELTCPISFHKYEAPVTTSEKFADVMIYAFINACTNMDLTSGETVDVVNTVLFGCCSEEDTPQGQIKAQHIMKHNIEDAKPFPIFNIRQVAERETPITATILGDEVIRKAFVNRYLSVFSQYLQWKSLALLQARKEQV